MMRMCLRCPCHLRWIYLIFSLRKFTFNNFASLLELLRQMCYNV